MKAYTCSTTRATATSKEWPACGASRWVSASSAWSKPRRASSRNCPTTIRSRTSRTPASSRWPSA
ncbi:Uncharacterised protein [Bordetella pertussis]|nr:Uncharacterised protein [Bordetella pertussis]